jgi:hypothetical protein
VTAWELSLATGRLYSFKKYYPGYAPAGRRMPVDPTKVIVVGLANARVGTFDFLERLAEEVRKDLAAK